MRAALIVCALAGFAAADSKPIAGSWSGAIDIPGQALAFTVTFDGTAAGLIDIPQQHATGVPIAKVDVTGTHVHFELVAANAVFDGELAGDAITGTMAQAGMTFRFHLAKTAAIVRATYAVPTKPRRPLTAHVGRGLLGAWRGTVEHDEVRATFADRAGLVVGTAAATSRCDPAAPIVETTLTFDRVHLEIAAPDGASYFDGTLAGDELTGTLFRGGTQTPLALHREPPAPPLPYREVEVAIPSTKGTTLAGTLTLPAATGTWPVVVLVTGSGPQDRDECVLGIRPFRQLAEALVKRQIATLRYDDRGTAKSTGDFKAATAADFADDAEAAVAFLAARPETAAIGVLGHSEGGLIAPMVAARNPRVGFIVLWAGPGLPLDEVIMKQTHDIGLAEGGTPDAVAREDRMAAVMWKAFRGAKDEAGFKRALIAGLATLPKAEREAITDVPAFVAAKTGELWTPWFRWYNNYDPRKTLAKVTVPVLAINGGMDKQVDAKTNLAAIGKALAKNRDAKLVELPGLNHVFQQTKTGAVSEYTKNSPVLDPVVLETTASWIEAHTRVKSAP